MTLTTEPIEFTTQYTPAIQRALNHDPRVIEYREHPGMSNMLIVTAKHVDSTAVPCAKKTARDLGIEELS